MPAASKPRLRHNTQTMKLEALEPVTPDREQARLKYLREQAARAHRSYEPKDWIGVVFSLRGRSGHHVYQPLIWVLCVSVAAAWSAHNAEKLGVSQRRWNRWLVRLETAELLLRMVMSFLLVFRLGRSAIRFWEARQKAGFMIEVCRTLASTAAACMVVGGDLDRVEHRLKWPETPAAAAAAAPPDAWMSTTSSPASALCRWVVVFPIAAKNYLRGDPGDPLELDGLLSKHEVEALFAAPNQCLYVIDTIRCIAMIWASSAVDSGGKPELVAQTFTTLQRQLDQLTGSFGGMERINNTPLPFVYVTHLRTSLLLYLTLIPITYAPVWLWGTPIVSFLVAWCLLGIEAAAVECERPVRGCANHMPLEAFCAVVADNVSQTLRHSASMGRRLREKRVSSTHTRMRLGWGDGLPAPPPSPGGNANQRCM